MAKDAAKIYEFLNIHAREIRANALKFLLQKELTGKITSLALQLKLTAILTVMRSLRLMLP